jgi:hypothetical protein
MQLGKSIVGAIIGAILGIVLLIAVYWVFGIDKMWMAIPVAILTGLGVRIVATTKGNASYLRGAITVLLAMGAYLGGVKITKAVVNQRAQTVKAAPAPSKSEEPADAGDAKDQPAAEAKPAEAPPMAPVKIDPSARRPALPNSFSTWDFLSLAVAALVAYELGRGTEAGHKMAGDERPSEPVPAGTHPDA